MNAMLRIVVKGEGAAKVSKVRKGCKGTQKYAPNSNLRTFEYLCDLDPRSGVNIEAGRG